MQVHITNLITVASTWPIVHLALDFMFRMQLCLRSKKQSQSCKLYHLTGSHEPDIMVLVIEKGRTLTPARLFPVKEESMETRICTKCNTEKPLDEEHFTSQRKGQFNHKCKTCRNVYHKEWRNSKSTADADYVRDKALRELYHKSAVWYDAKLESQGGHCALCNAVYTGGTKRLSVDHDHRCCPDKHSCGDCVRGILCFTCNKRLGYLEIFVVYNIEGSIVPLPGTWLARALDYIGSYNVQFNFGYNALSAVA